MTNETERPMPDAFEHHGMYLPHHMIGGIQRYIRNGVPPGSFLSAVINNDLQTACGCADDQNERIIPAYVAYLYNHAPIGSWGFSGAVEDWTKRLRKEREDERI